MEKIGVVAYRIDLPPSSTVHHPVFHVSQLKKMIGTDIQPQPFPLCLTSDLELHLQPESMLSTKFSSDGQT